MRWANAERRQRVARHSGSLVARRVEQAEMRRASHLDHGAHREGEHRLIALRHQRQQPRDRRARQRSRSAGRRDRTEPALGAESPARQRSSVDLPTPLGPSTQTTSPAAISRLMPENTGLARPG